MKDTPADYEPCAACEKTDPRRWRGTWWYRKEKEPAVEPLTWRDAYTKARRFARVSRGRFRMSTHPNDSISVHGIGQVLDSWEAVDGWIPDVVVIDYADICADEPGVSGQELRHKDDAKWKALRRLSQVRHAFVLTASQTDTEAYTSKRVKMSNFSDNRTKNDHVNATFGMTQTPQQKRQGVILFNGVLIREGDYDPLLQVAVLQCIQRGQPFLGSFRWREALTK